jgi:hypothetical protein
VVVRQERADPQGVAAYQELVATAIPRRLRENDFAFPVRRFSGPFQATVRRIAVAQGDLGAARPAGECGQYYPVGGPSPTSQNAQNRPFPGDISVPR